MEIRSLRGSDLKELSYLILTIYDEYPMALKFSQRPSDGELASLLDGKLEGMKSGTVIDLVATEGGRVIGECEVVRIGTGDAIVGVLVLRGQRRKGLGSTLMQEAMAIAKSMGIKRFVAEVRDENRPALSFFTNNGFVLERREGSVAHVSRSL